MNIKTGNFLTEIGIDNTIEKFQNIGYKILHGNYIDKKFKESNKIIDFNEFQNTYKNDIGSLSTWDICYYRICKTEATSIITFLNSALDIICNIETIPESGDKFK